MTIDTLKSGYGATYGIVKKTENYQVSMKPISGHGSAGFRVRVNVTHGTMKVATLQEDLHLPELDLRPGGHSAQNFMVRYDMPKRMLPGLAVVINVAYPKLLTVLMQRVGATSPFRDGRAFIEGQVLGPFGLTEESLNAALDASSDEIKAEYKAAAKEIEEKLDPVLAKIENLDEDSKTQVADLLEGIAGAPGSTPSKGEMSEKAESPEDSGEDDAAKDDDGSPDEAA